MRIILMFIGSLLIAGCSDPNPRETNKLNVERQTGRIRVVSAQYVVNQEGQEKDILVLQDSLTGIEYVAVNRAVNAAAEESTHD